MSSSRREISILDSYEQMALLKQPNPRAPTGLRNLCIISLMLKIGLRVNEAVNLKDNDIDWEEGRVRISGSGAAKERILNLDKPELSLMKKWQDQKPSDCDYFFCTLDGSKLQDRYIREMIKRLAKKAGLEKDVYPHLLRYTFAVEFIRETGDLEMLQEALGHRDTAATQNYAKLLFDNYNFSYSGGKATRRSGLPVLIKNYKTEQKYFAFESGKAYINSQVSDSSVESAAQKSKEYKIREAKKAEDDNQAKTKNDKKPVSENINEFKLRINIDEDPPEPNARTPIPSIKCSNCNYILRYKGDCPKCGISFEKIMKHWGRFV